MRMMRGIFVLCFATLGGCGADAPTETEACAVDDCTQTSMGRLCATVEPFGTDTVDSWPTIDGILAGVARRAPGFGGFRIETDRVVILMVNPTQAGAEAARDELLEVYGSGRFQGVTVAAQSTPFDYVDLLTFYVRARNVLGLEGVVWSDINESQGRIEYGVLDDEVAACVNANLERLSVPASAATTQPSEPIRPLDD